MFNRMHGWYFSALLVCSAVAAPAASACTIKGAILLEYNRNGIWQHLGFCITDETVTGGVYSGRYQQFQNGMIFWTPWTGAHTVWGRILDKYTSMGWWTSILGFPTTSESTTPDGVGRFNGFEHGMIYWTPSTDAHEVHGAILDKWASLAYERGPCGYPTSDEMDGQFGIRFNYFEHGAIQWRSDYGAVANCNQ